MLKLHCDQGKNNFLPDSVIWTLRPKLWDSHCATVTALMPLMPARSHSSRFHAKIHAATLLQAMSSALLESSELWLTNTHEVQWWLRAQIRWNLFAFGFAFWMPKFIPKTGVGKGVVDEKNMCESIHWYHLSSPSCKKKLWTKACSTLEAEAYQASKQSRQERKPNCELWHQHSCHSIRSARRQLAQAR